MYLNIKLKFWNCLSSVPRGLEEADRLARRSREKTGLRAGDLQRARQDQSPTGQTQGKHAHFSMQAYWKFYFSLLFVSIYKCFSFPPFLCLSRSFRKLWGRNSPFTTLQWDLVRPWGTRHSCLRTPRNWTTWWERSATSGTLSVARV